MEELKKTIEQYGFNTKQYYDGIGIVLFNTQIGFVNTFSKTISADNLPIKLVEQIAQLLNNKTQKYYIKIKLFCTTQRDVKVACSEFCYVNRGRKTQKIILGDKQQTKHQQTQFDDYEIEPLKKFLNYFDDSVILERVENE